MKRLALTFLFIYLFIFITLSSIGQKGEFCAEKTFWTINSQANRIIQDPNNAPQAEIDKLVGQYRKFINQFSDTNIGPAGYFQITRLYWLIKNYEKSRLISKEVIARYTGRPEIAARGYAQLAESYLQQGNTAEAINTYNNLLKNYPLTTIGLNAPILKAQTYVEANNANAAQAAFIQAITYYENLITQHPRSAIEVQSLKLIATIHMANKEWKKATEKLGEILIKFGLQINGSIANEIVKMINSITLSQTKDYDGTIHIYAQFINQYPKHPFNPIFQNLIKGFNSLKNKAG